MADIRERVDWEQVKKRLKDRYPALTDDDLEIENEDKLFNQLEAKLGEDKDEIRNIIKDI
jgi:hypothetical protein